MRNDANEARVPDHLLAAILTTFLACTPFGLVSWYYAMLVQQELRDGNRPGAVAASVQARRWAWIAFSLGLLFYLVFALFAYRLVTVWWPYNVVRGEFRI